MSSHCLVDGVGASNEFHYPEGYFHEPNLCRPLSIAASVVSGIVKTILFPATSAFATVVFLLKAIYACGNGNTEESQRCWSAALLNLVGCTASLVFLVISAYYLPIMGASVIVMVAMTVSVVMHVKKAAESFPPDIDLHPSDENENHYFS